jgi:hypothetical protein
MLMNKTISCALIMLFAFVVGACVMDTVSAEVIEGGSQPTPLDDKDKILAESETGSGSVMGTSVFVTVTDNELDIKRVETQEIYQGGGVLLKVTLENLSSSDEQIEKAVLSVKNLDGGIESSESIDLNENLQPTEETEISLEFPSNLTAGVYVGVIDLYSKERLLGSSETVLSVLPVTPEVLGAYVIHYEDLLLPSALVFAAVLVFSAFILLKKKNLLLKGVSIKLFDLIIIILALSVFGIGVCGGYIFSKAFFTPGLYLVEKQTSAEGSADIDRVEGSIDEAETEFIYDNGSISVYAKPGDEEKVIYELNEEASFKIIDQAAGWFRVQLEDGRSGWVKIEDVRRIIEK